MVSAPHKKNKSRQRGALAIVVASALGIGVGFFGAELAQAQEDTDPWQELRAIELLLRKDAEAALPRALALRARTVDESDQRLRARILLVECSAHYRAGDSDLAVVACDDANDIANQLGDPALLASTRNMRATVAYSTGRTTQAFVDYESAYRYAVLSGEVELLSPIQSNLAVIVRNSGAIGASVPYSQRALEAALAIEDHARIALVLLNLSDTYVDLGQLQMAEDHVRRALEHADKGDIMRWRYAARLQQAFLLLEQERGEEALAALNKLATIEALKPEPRQLARLRILFADAYRATGDIASALVAAEESVAIVEGVGDRWRAAKWSIDLAKLQRLNNKPAEALTAIDTVESFARSGSHDRLLRSALSEKAEILLASQKPAEAYAALKESRDIERRMESREAEAQLWLLSAREEARQARQTITELDERRIVAERRADLNVRVRNAVLLALALVLSAGLYWRNRSVRMALSREVERRTEALRLETSERTRHQKARLDAEEQVRHLQKLEAIGRLTGGIAHDFNNLLTAVNGSLELLKMSAGERLEEQDLQLIEDALSAGNAGAAVTGQLLAFARKKPLQPERFDCVQHVRDISSLLRRAVGERIPLDITLPDENIQVDLDRSQLTTALLNLVDNARDAVGDAGEIVITIESERIGVDRIREIPELSAGDYASIVVRDNGCGMTKEEIQHAFQPFYSTKDFSAGAGLGLSMVYGFARQSDGTALLESSTGTGTTVTLLLPVAERLASRDAAAPTTAESGRLGTALVVEDQNEVRVVACAFLDSLGFETLGAKNADEAVTIIESGANPRFLFVDIVMPGSMNGREFAAWAQKKLPGAEILLTTGYADAFDQGDCPFPVLHKPYRVEELSAYLSARFGDTQND